MTWVLMGIFVVDVTFYFRVLDMHHNHFECLYAAELHTQKIGKPNINFATVCVPTDQIEGSVL